jgi:hypothetical protein
MVETRVYQRDLSAGQGLAMKPFTRFLSFARASLTRLSRWGPILITCYYRLIEIDDFMANLWKVHLAVKQEGYAHVRFSGLCSCTQVTDHPQVS